MSGILFLCAIGGASLLYSTESTLSSSDIHSEHQQLQMPPLSVHVYNTMQPVTQTHIRSTTKSDADAHAHAYAENNTSVKMYVEQLCSSIVHNSGITQYPSRIQSYICAHPHYFAFTTGMILYISICTYFYTAYIELTKKNRWALWQAEKSLTDLLKQDNKITTEQLLLAIQATHTNSANPTDFLLPIVTFYNEVQKEIDQLERYQWYYSACKKSYITKCIPSSLEVFETIQNQLDRAYFVQSIFKQWAAHYNVRTHLS